MICIKKEIITLDDDETGVKKDPATQKAALTKQQIINQLIVSASNPAQTKSPVITPTVPAAIPIGQMPTPNTGFVINQTASQAPTLIPIFSNNIPNNNNNVISNTPITLIPSGSVAMPPIAGPIVTPLVTGPANNMNQQIRPILSQGSILLTQPPLAATTPTIQTPPVKLTMAAVTKTTSVETKPSSLVLNVEISNSKPGPASAGSSLSMVSPAIPYLPPGNISIQDLKVEKKGDSKSEESKSKKSILSDLFSDLTDTTCSSSFSLSSFQSSTKGFNPEEAKSMPKEILNSATNPIVLSPDSSPEKSSITRVAESAPKPNSSIIINKIRENFKTPHVRMSPSILSLLTSDDLTLKSTPLEENKFESKNPPVATVSVQNLKPKLVTPSVSSIIPQESTVIKPEYTVLKELLSEKDDSKNKKRYRIKIKRSDANNKLSAKNTEVESAMDISIKMDIAKIKTSMAEAEKQGTSLKPSVQVQFKKGNRKKVIQHAENSFVNSDRVTNAPEDKNDIEMNEPIDDSVNSLDNTSDAAGCTESSRETSPLKKKDSEEIPFERENYCVSCCKAFKDKCNFLIFSKIFQNNSLVLLCIKSRFNFEEYLKEYFSKFYNEEIFE